MKLVFLLKYTDSHKSIVFSSFLPYITTYIDPNYVVLSLYSEGRMREVVCISTLRGEYKLGAVYAHNMVELISKFLSGLKERSVYAVAVQDCNRQGACSTKHCTLPNN